MRTAELGKTTREGKSHLEPKALDKRDLAFSQPNKAKLIALWMQQTSVKHVLG